MVKNQKRKKNTEYMRIWRSKNRDKVRAANKRYRENNYDKCKAGWDKWRKENKEHVKLRDKKYREKNKEHLEKKRIEYVEKNKEKLLTYWRERRKKPEVKARDNATKRISTKKRFARDPNARLANLIRSRIQKALVNCYKSSSSIELLGCSIDECRRYLESKFIEGMNWDTIHIDHVKPCASFDLTKPEEQAKCFHYTNLQPLLAIDNLKKGAKYNG